MRDVVQCLSFDIFQAKIKLYNEFSFRNMPAICREKRMPDQLIPWLLRARKKQAEAKKVEKRKMQKEEGWDGENRKIFSTLPYKT